MEFTNKIDFKEISNHYVIDWEKIKTHDDLVVILKNFNMGFENPTEDLKKLCVLVNKFTGEKV